jgi:hypothetical protein
MIVRFSVSVVCALHLHLIVPAGDSVTDFSEKTGKRSMAGSFGLASLPSNGRVYSYKSEWTGDRGCTRMGRGTLMSIRKR